MPNWASSVSMRDSERAPGVVIERLNTAIVCVNAWRAVRNRRLFHPERQTHLQDAFEHYLYRELSQHADRTAALKNFQERRWGPMRRLIHIAEPVIDKMRSRSLFWDSKGADSPTLRALFDLVWQNDWVAPVITYAEGARVQSNKAAGLEPAETFRFELAESLQILGGQGDFISS